MLNYNTYLTTSAEKDLRRLETHLEERILRKVESLSGIPLPNGSIKLKGGSDNVYRIRVGDYRVIYEINENEKSVTIHRIRHRKEVYR